MKYQCFLTAIGRVMVMAALGLGCGEEGPGAADSAAVPADSGGSVEASGTGGGASDAGGSGIGSEPPASGGTGSAVDAGAPQLDGEQARDASPGGGIPDTGPGADAAIHPEPIACPSSLALHPGDHDVAIQYAGLNRSYRIHLPPGYDRTSAVPLVLNIHGLTQTGPVQQLASQFDRVADAHGVAVVYPTSDSASWNAGACCNVFGPDDVTFMRKVIEETRKKVCVDPKRIYVTGMSNGAAMTHRLACDAADLFAAAAPVAAPLPVTDAMCRPARAIPLLQVHGTSDQLVGYEGGGAVTFILTDPAVPALSAPVIVAGWARRNGCATTPSAATPKDQWPAEPVSGGLIAGAGAPLFTDEQTKVEVPKTPGATCQWYPDCKDGSEVGLCSHDGGHDWASGSSAAIWKFFARHSLP